MANKLNQLSADILNNLVISNYKDTQKPKASEKRAAAYEIGVKLVEAREEFQSNDEYGEWCRSVIIEKLPDGFFKNHDVAMRTFRNYRKLPEFGSLALCERVGFSRVYDLMKEANKQIREWVQANHESFKTKKTLVDAIEEKLKGGQPVEQQETSSIQVVGTPGEPTSEAVQALQERIDAMQEELSAELQSLREENAKLKAENAEMKPIVEEHKLSDARGKLMMGDYYFKSMHRLREITDAGTLKRNWKEFANLAHPDKETSKLLPEDFDLGLARANYRTRLKELQ